MARISVVLPVPHSPWIPMVRGVRVRLAAMIRAKVLAYSSN